MSAAMNAAMNAAMSSHQDMAAAPHPAGSLAQSLARWLGIDDSDLDLLADLLDAGLAANGTPGRNILARVKGGAVLGRAFEVPDAATEVLYARAHRWVAVGRHDRAEPIFRALCVLDETSADFWTGLGICLRARSAWDEALAAFATASQKRPRWAVPHFHALELCLRRGAWARAAIELAAFDDKADGEVPPALVAEASRYGKVLARRGAHGKGGARHP